MYRDVPDDRVVVITKIRNRVLPDLQLDHAGVDGKAFVLTGRVRMTGRAVLVRLRVADLALQIYVRPALPVSIVIIVGILHAGMARFAGWRRFDFITMLIMT